ncbi:MAG TPA: LemA family protein, partial [Sphingomicrobium sp.]|nr:LemA family protein [Sphingomicrobium sp.]
MITWIVIGVVVLALLYGVAVYNRLVRLRQLVREGFSGITVQLRRRADLVPNLVSTVQGYATHERETLDQVIAPRGEVQKAKGVEATAAADNAMTAMIGRLFAVAEAYPDLKADENFRQLQDELSEIEGEL